MDLQIGIEIDGYRIDGILGRGGMGTVYRAVDLELARPVALKVISPDKGPEQSFASRFRLEARALAKIDSPFIVGVHALRQSETAMFIAMELVDGQDLSETIQNNPVDSAAALGIMEQLLMALEHAHAAGVIHRDIKPSNIMLTRDGSVKVTDFGLAKADTHDITLTVSGAMMGTVAYMSPEQVRGERVDFRTDLWSAGVVFYEMLVGRRPFVGEYEAAILYSIVSEDPVPPGDIDVDLSDEIWQFITRTLQKDPDSRYQDAPTMRSALQTAGQGLVATQLALPGKSTPTSAGRPKNRWARRVAVAVVLVGILGLGSYLLYPTPFDRNGSLQEQAESIEPDSGTEVGSSSAEGQFDLARPEEIPQAGDEINDGTSDLANSAPASSPPVAPAIVTIESDEDVEVAVGGGASRQPGHVTVIPGSHRIVCTHAVYGRAETTVEVSAGDSLTVACFFEATINVNSSPVWGTVWINGRSVERTTPAQIRLGPGTYDIDVKRFGYHSSGQAEPIVITPSFDEPITHRLAFTLTANR